MSDGTDARSTLSRMEQSVHMAKKMVGNELNALYQEIREKNVVVNTLNNQLTANGEELTRALEERDQYAEQYSSMVTFASVAWIITGVCLVVSFYSIL